MAACQEGGPFLGQAHLVQDKLPKTQDGRELFMIGLPNGLAGDRAAESLLHTQLRDLVFKYLINDDAYTRQSRDDPVTRDLLLNLRAAVHGKTNRGAMKEWSASKDGLPGFILRYMHYVLFGLVLNDEHFGLLWQLYFNPGPGLGDSHLIVMLMRYIGTAKACLGDVPMKEHPARRQTAIDFYLTSPSMMAYAETEAVKPKEFLDMMVTVLGLAGLMGPMGALAHTLGNYKKYIPENYEWPVGDSEKVKLAVLEAMRMQPAVFGSGLAAPQPIRCMQNGKPKVFPKNTPVHVNFVAANRYKKIWGEKADQFDPEEHAKLLEGDGCPYPNFNSWGGQVAGDASSGRECPGKKLSMTLLVDVVEFVMPIEAPFSSVPKGQEMSR